MPSMPSTNRDRSGHRDWRHRFWKTVHEPFDVVVVGGGVQGACLYARLAREGRRVLLIDRKDFGGGTSQASAMLVWGGLLYLKNAEFIEVMRMCASRDRLLRQHPELTEPHYLSYVFGRPLHSQPWFIHAGLWVYWLLGGGRRAVPRGGREFPEQAFLSDDSAIRRLRFEEGHLRVSDAQFVLDWIGRAEGGVASNYCSLEGGAFDPQLRRWRLQLRDTLGENQTEIAAKWVVNAAGVWTDRVNAGFGMESPWQHLLAKGVSFSFPRHDGHHDTLVFDGAAGDQGMSLVPWGPVSLWGSTETITRSPDEGWQVEPEDLQFLLTHLNAKMATALEPRQITSLRCGVRPLAVPRGTTAGNPLELSKRWCIHRDPQRPWISIYGGKITACLGVAARVAGMLGDALGKQQLDNSIHSIGWHGQVPLPVGPTPLHVEAELSHFPGLEQPVPSAEWSRDHQSCCTLEDYLRRRTNIAQWVPRGGLGRRGEHRGELLRLAGELCEDAATAAAMMDEYESTIVRTHDAILGTQPTTAEYAQGRGR